jgi:RNA polymerase sigma-70 factor, ECF subfamily
VVQSLQTEHHATGWIGHTWQETDRRLDAPVVDHLAPLVARMADGDHPAAAALHRACYSPLLRIARLIVRDHADAEEVVSDTFAKAWREAASFDGARGSVAGWLTMMVRSRARDFVRARMRRDRAHDRAEVQAAVDRTAINVGWSAAWDVACVLEIREREATLSRVLLQLPPKQRRVIELVFLGGVSHTTAAEQLGVPLGTVKTRVRLGLKRMRVLFDGSGVTRWTH